MKQQTNIEVKGLSSIVDVQSQFNHAFPYLQLGIFSLAAKTGCYNFSNNSGQKIAGWLTAIPAEVTRELLVDENMTVAELEQAFFENFGCRIKVYRRCGRVWLQTKLTNSWTLKQQNQIAEEIDHTTDL